MQDIQWQVLTFEQLSTAQLYQLLQLRIEVFVVEQTCFYQDLDGKDKQEGTGHVMGYCDGELVAYSRVLAPGVSYAGKASIGRVIVLESARGLKLGDRLIERSLQYCLSNWPDVDIQISAQEHLQGYYQKHGFVTVSKMYFEDDIPHVAMCAPSK